MSVMRYSIPLGKAYRVTLRRRYKDSKEWVDSGYMIMAYDWNEFSYLVKEINKDYTIQTMTVDFYDDILVARQDT